MRALQSSRQRVTIIGGSYSGLITGIALARLGLNVSLLEFNRVFKKTARDEPCKLLAISKNSLAIVQEYLGLNLAKYGQSINQIKVLDHGDASMCLDFNPPEAGLDNFGIMIDEFKLNSLLIKKASTIANLTLIEDFKVTDIKNDGDLASVYGSQGKCYESEIVLVCDGKNSHTKSLLGVENYHKNYHQSAIVCDVSHEHNHMGVAVEKFTTQGPFAILPKKGGHDSSIVWTLPTELAQTVLKLDKISQLELVAQKFDGHLGQLKIASKLKAYPLNLNYSTTYCQGRFYILGDALHSIHPLAGQGLNLSLRDCQFLVSSIKESLALGLDIGSNAIINQYSKARFIDNQAMIEGTNFLNGIFSNDSHFLKAARIFGLDAINELPSVKKYFMLYASGLAGL